MHLCIIKCALSFTNDTTGRRWLAGRKGSERMRHSPGLGGGGSPRKQLVQSGQTSQLQTWIHCTQPDSVISPASYRGPGASFPWVKLLDREPPFIPLHRRKLCAGLYLHTAKHLQSVEHNYVQRQLLTLPLPLTLPASSYSLLSSEPSLSSLSFSLFTLSL